ncbi:MAG: hypothetical protein RLY93_04985 [Sumerlaeia bacterium]
MLFPIRHLPALLCLLLLSPALAPGQPEHPIAPQAIPLADWEKGAAPLPPFNERVLDIAGSYPIDGTHAYWWPRAGESAYDGCTTNVLLFGEPVMEGEPGGRTFCCGLTLEVFARAWTDAWAPNPGASPLQPKDWQRFQSLWFVPEINASGPSAALEEFGAGRTLAMAAAMPGDFVQIWRRPAEGKTHGSGHSVIFLGWVRNEDGDAIGLRYWSTQPGTEGIGQATEYFAPPSAHKGVAAEWTHWGRAEVPAG